MRNIQTLGEAGDNRKSVTPHSCQNNPINLIVIARPTWFLAVKKIRKINGSYSYSIPNINFLYLLNYLNANNDIISKTR